MLPIDATAIVEQRESDLEDVAQQHFAMERLDPVVLIVQHLVGLLDLRKSDARQARKRRTDQVNFKSRSAPDSIANASVSLESDHGS
jgi:hypothetical protein